MNNRQENLDFYWSRRDCRNLRQFLRPFFLSFVVTLLALTMLLGFLLVEQAAEDLGTADPNRLASWEQTPSGNWTLKVMGYPLELSAWPLEQVLSFCRQHPCLVPVPLRLGAAMGQMVAEQTARMFS